MQRLIWGAVALFCAGPAWSHSFDAGADAYGQIVEGAGVVLTFPTLILPLLALGLLLSLWDPDGLPRVWPVFLAGQVAGVFVAALSGPGVVTLFLILGLLTAVIGALLPRVVRPVALLAAGATGCGAMVVALEGHGLFELPLFTHLGLLFGVNLGTALAAGIARLGLGATGAPWMRIGWRVAASWIGAILLLTLAFEVAGSAGPQGGVS